MPYGYIYKIQFSNGKHYIGLTTTSLERRKIEHKYHAKRGDKQYLYNAIRKYEMIDTFELIEIDMADTLEELCEKEIGYIQEYNSYYLNEKGYNMTFGGEGPNGYVYTEDVKQKMSEAKKKHFEKPDAREKQSERTKNYYKKNPEAGKEHCEALKKYYEKNPEAGQKNGEKRKEYYKKNPEARRKLSDTKGKNKPFDVFTKDGTFVKTFCYQFEAKEYLQKEHHITSTINIIGVLAGRDKSSAGFVFKYK
jgi:group I intron endonuclease